MKDRNFEIKILDLHWIQNFDSPEDLCAHGHLYLKIGNQVISDKQTGDWTLSSTALSLLRTIENNYERDEYSNQLLPCCGHFFIADDNEETVIIQGCNIGIDWKIIHSDNNKVKHILEHGYEISLNRDDYKSIVLNFADEVEQFYRDSKVKVIPTDDFERKGYLTFWKEWRRLRDKWK
jgi:hypothetical protein